ncbi:MAG: rhomboid family intramembrane serine protease [Ilumatobacteraceae bacterium]|jgi:membrane associated rhomboid family serine protease|nr:rhomboid family intramembrane serine protease [Ilumatobacteraceae bacterium]
MSEFAPPVLPRCYRHPNMPTGRSCTRCGRPACGDCLQAVTIGSQCPDCIKASRPPATVRAKDWNASQDALITRIIMALNVAVFVWVLIGDTSSAGFGSSISPREVELGLNKLLLSFNHEWYRLITSGFLHFGILHIAMNMYLLFQLGKLLEPPLGRLRYGLLYFACLLGGSLGVLVLEGSSTGLHGGASGAVFGLMGAAAIGMQRRGINIFQTGLGATLMINLLLTFTIPGISIGGHIGGIVMGAICGSIMLPPPQQKQPPWLGYAVPTIAIIGSVIASVIVVG